MKTIRNNERLELSIRKIDNMYYLHNCENCTEYDNRTDAEKEYSEIVKQYKRKEGSFAIC